jgi:hypothetical protein
MSNLMDTITIDQVEKLQNVMPVRSPLALWQSGFEPDPDPDRCKLSSIQRRKYLIEIGIGIEIEAMPPHQVGCANM